MTRETVKAIGWRLLLTLILACLIVAGSRNLAHFDAALVGYTFAVLFATFAITYRYSMWLQRPPTALYWKRGWQVFFRPSHLATNIAPITAVMAIFMACPLISTFTVGALGMAAAIGLGNGAVFKLVPEYFPQSVGSVTGLVGAAGGLGGFFPPLVVGSVRQATGTFTWGFIFLSLFAIFCLVVAQKIAAPAVRRADLVQRTSVCNKGREIHPAGLDQLQ